MIQLVPKHLMAKSGLTGTHIVTRKNFYDLAGEIMERHNKTHDGGWDTMKLMRGGSNILMNTFVGFELEDLMSKETLSYLFCTSTGSAGWSPSRFLRGPP